MNRIGENACNGDYFEIEGNHDSSNDQKNFVLYFSADSWHVL